MICFDLPSETANDKKEYRNFKNYLTQKGYNYLQKSIYIKYLRNKSAYNYELISIKKYCPEHDETFFQIDTYGAKDRKFVNKVS